MAVAHRASPRTRPGRADLGGRLPLVLGAMVTLAVAITFDMRAGEHPTHTVALALVALAVAGLRLRLGGRRDAARRDCGRRHRRRSQRTRRAATAHHVAPTDAAARLRAAAACARARAGSPLRPASRIDAALVRMEHPGSATRSAHPVVPLTPPRRRTAA
jgi:hypothetical protein